MPTILRDILIIMRAIALFLSIGAAVAAIFYYLKSRDLFGGFIGGTVVGVIGALIGGLLSCFAKGG